MVPDEEDEEVEPLPTDFSIWMRRKRANWDHPEIVWYEMSGEWPVPMWRYQLDDWYNSIYEDAKPPDRDNKRAVAEVGNG